ncbi:MAG: 4-hydroxythreonine-4-phosphate dehydrogenase PdxA [Bacteroidetes bacterium]|nr:4-hydroxythreonine-4-phosphate dehydrogenase PdxA [Bacteroidota bacterium]MCL2302048.1 4-hydroxythreonine-4-phosphate dehydrogenase PdxA [Lentimicrobiaceae bacterium]
MEQLYKIGITHGDLNGISYEVIMKALADPKIMEICTPVVYGLAKAASYHRKVLEMNDFSFQFVKNAQQSAPKKPNLINLGDEEVKIVLGESSEVGGKMASLALNVACNDLKNKAIDAIVTAPIHKHNIQSPNFNFAGHTEFFSAQFNVQNTMMLMVAENIKVGFVTNHIPINEMGKVLTTELVLRKIKILNDSLLKDFLCTHPKIAVLALNPHAGDKGLLGKEEVNILKPAINQAFDQNINAFGPFPADGFFASGQYEQFDAVLAMYHDQGMIPFKLLAYEGGVNFTAGLPIVRTSPAHGTGYDIAGKNIASPDSLRHAIYLAIDILNNRKAIQ